MYRHPRRDKFVDDAWNWSTVCPSISFHSSLPLLLPSVGQISRTQRFLFLDQRESPDFSFEGKSSKMGRRDSRTPRFLREYRFFDRFLLWTRSMHKCTEYGSKSKFKLLVVLRRSFVEEVDHVVAREMADLNSSISPIRLIYNDYISKD